MTQETKGYHLKLNALKGGNPQEVVERLSQELKLSSKTAQHIIQTLPMVFDEEVSYSKAQALLEKFEEAGIGCEIVPVQTTEEIFGETIVQQPSFPKPIKAQEEQSEAITERSEEDVLFDSLMGESFIFRPEDNPELAQQMSLSPEPEEPPLPTPVSTPPPFAQQGPSTPVVEWTPSPLPTSPPETFENIAPSKGPMRLKEEKEPLQKKTPPLTGTGVSPIPPRVKTTQGANTQGHKTGQIRRPSPVPPIKGKSAPLADIGVDPNKRKVQRVVGIIVALIVFAVGWGGYQRWEHKQKDTQKQYAEYNKKLKEGDQMMDLGFYRSAKGLYGEAFDFALKNKLNISKGEKDGLKKKMEQADKKQQEKDAAP